MAFYKQPIRPFDPVVPEDQPLSPIRYVRDNFSGTGQDSHTNPPAQDSAMWQQLTNVMPIVDGTLNVRWGYDLFNSNTTAQRMYEFQSDSSLQRNIILTNGLGTGGAVSLNEDGSVSSANLNVGSSSGAIPRMVASRGFGYFCDGVAADLKKWNGVTTKWGIDVNNVANAQIGPLSPATILDQGGAHPWTNPSNAKVADGSFASCIMTVPGGTNVLQTLGHGFAVSGTVTGIQVNFKGFASVATGGGGTQVVTVRPSSFSNPATVGDNGFNPPGSAFDNNPSTYAKGTALGGNIRAGIDPTIADCNWSGFPASPGSSANVLKVTIGVPAVSGVGKYLVQYSLDGGATRNLIANLSSQTAPTTFVITLPGNQDLTKVQVFGLVSCSTQGQSFSGQVFEIWIETTVPIPPTPGGTQPSLLLTLVKNGTAYGAGKVVTLPASNQTFSLGGPGDLWGGSWLPSDINNATTGLITACSNSPNTNATMFLDAISITVFLSGAGVIQGAPVAGLVSLTVGRVYYVVAKNSSTGHYSDLSSPSASTGPVTSKGIPLTLPVFADPQVDTKALLATADGGDPSILYLVSEFPNSQTAVTDNTPDTTLVTQQQLLFTDEFGTDFGVAANSPPPVGNICIKHKGRLWMPVKQALYFSKSVGDLTLPNGFIAGKYEEAWPGDNFFDISGGAETVSGLLSDGSTLYIGTQRHVRSLFGDNPDNFQQPEIVHQEVGVLNHEVWKSVFTQGAPSGAIWLTPDNRVIQSDFNTYIDIGVMIQDVLNTINPVSAPTQAHAMFVSQGPYDLYILAVPTGNSTQADTHLVFDLRSHMWFPWRPSDTSTSMLFNINKSGEPQWLLGTPAGVMQYESDATTDNGKPFTTTATTSWMHLGMPTARKILNEVEVIGDSNLTMTVNGASTQAEFLAPQSVTSAQTLVIDPLGHNKLFLAATTTKSRYYQLIFISSGGASAPVSDDFNRTNQILSASPNWVSILSPNIQAQLFVVNNACGLPANQSGRSGALSYWLPSLGFISDAYVQATLTRLPATVGYAALILYGSGDTTNFTGYFAGVDLAVGANNQYVIEKAVGNVFSTLAASSQIAVVGDVVRLTKSGTTVSLSVNGVTILSATDTSPLSNGQSGLAIDDFTGSDTQGFFDDFQTTDVAKDFLDGFNILAYPVHTS